MGMPTKYMKARYFLTALSLVEKQQAKLNDLSIELKNDILKKLDPLMLKVVRSYYGFDGVPKKIFSEIAKESLILTPDNIKYQHTKALQKLDKVSTKIDIFFQLAENELLKVVETYLGVNNGNQS